TPRLLPQPLRDRLDGILRLKPCPGLEVLRRAEVPAKNLGGLFGASDAAVVDALGPEASAGRAPGNSFDDRSARWSQRPFGVFLSGHGRAVPHEVQLHLGTSRSLPCELQTA